MTARYSASDYGVAARALMPRGRVWTFEPGTRQAAILDSLMPAMERVDAAGGGLLADIQPRSTTGLLEEWEATLGLPDPCLGPNPTDDQRRDQVVARFSGGGGQSGARFIAYAAALGFTVSITTYAPFRAGRSAVGRPLCGALWPHVWLVTIVSDEVSSDHAAFRTGHARAGDALASTAAGHQSLECELRRIAPAHTLLLFTY